MRKIAACFALACELLLSPSAPTAARRLFTPEDHYLLREAASPQISPDGKSVVFTVVTHSRVLNADVSSVWLAPTGGSQAAQRLTEDARVVPRPAWSPDGRRIAYLSDAQTREPGGGTPQVRLLSFAGGESRQVTSLMSGVREFHWSPDGARLVCVGSSRPSEAAGPEAGRAAASDTRHYRDILYKRDGRGFYDGRRDHLWVIDVESGAATKITDGDWDDRQPEWSPDSRWIVFVSDRSGHAFSSSQTSDIWVISVAGGEPRNVTDHDHGRRAVEAASAGRHSPVASRSPHWSPDGTRIAFLASAEEGGEVAVWMAQSTGVGVVEPVFRDDSLFTGYGNDVIWRDDALYYIGNDHGAQQVFRADLVSGQTTRLTAGDRFRADLAVDAAGKSLAFTSNDFQHPSELYVSEGGHERRLTQLNQPILQQLELSSLIRVSTVRTADGLPIDGFLARPYGWRPGKTYPLVLLIHGGPSNMFGFGWTAYMQALTARGYAVFFTNPRGSSGYGWDFIKADDGEWAGRGYTDIMTGLNAMLAQNSWIDRARMGVSGASYGGFMTNWIVSHTDRFAAAVAVASISNLVSLQGTRDEAYGHAQAFGGDLFQNYDVYWASSPLRYARDVKTPTLILHGEADDRVPIEQAEQWFRALRHFDVPSELVLFPREHHSSFATGEPRHVVEAMRWMTYWFDRYLQPNVDAVAPDQAASRSR